MRHSHFLLIAAAPILAAAAACSTKPLPLAVRCTIEGVGTPSRPWRQIHTARFDFCVPPGWTTQDSVSWSYANDQVTWSFGAPPRLSGPIRAQVQTISVDELQRLQARGPVRCSEPSPETETIADHQVQISIHDCHLVTIASAVWQDTQLFFVGSANSHASGEQELAIYRTVRFPAP